jgi:hypothetical protein
MTTQEIYTLANEIKENEFNNLFNGFNLQEEKTFNSLVELGDRKEVALWTVIAKRYEAVSDNEIYQNAYHS